MPSSHTTPPDVTVSVPRLPTMQQNEPACGSRQSGQDGGRLSASMFRGVPRNSERASMTMPSGWDRSHALGALPGA